MNGLYSSNTTADLDYHGKNALFTNSTTNEGEAIAGEGYAPSLPIILGGIAWITLGLLFIAWRLYVDSKEPEYVRRGPWLKYFSQSGCQMHIKEEDIQNITESSDEEKGGSVESTDDTVEELEDQTVLVLSGKGLKNGDFPVVVNCCAICMDSYQVGETAVWSCDTSCSHVFHRNCFIDYLMKHRGDDTPCPICRQNFCTISHPPQLSPKESAVLYL